MTWIIVGVVIYLLIGIGIWIHGVLTADWGGLLLYPWAAILIILGYPILLIRYAFTK